MTEPVSPSRTRPKPDSAYLNPLLKRFWALTLAPSHLISEPDQRRQASLLSGLLLSVVILTGIAEVIAVVLITDPGYRGYLQTIPTLSLLLVVYGFSRTRYVQQAATLTVVICTLAIFIGGWAEPIGILDGWFDYLIFPLWLGSLFISLKRLPMLVFGIIVGLLAFPLARPEVSLSDMLIGPFTFMLTTSVFLIIITRHRNQLEYDRQAELAAQEQHSRRTAARAQALLRVSERLNAGLHQEGILVTISEEVSRALDIPIAIVTLYDQQHDRLIATTGVGVEPAFLQRLPPITRADYLQTTERYGKTFTCSGLPTSPELPELLQPIREAGIHSVACATMEYEQQLVGHVSAMTSDDQHSFTQDDVLLLQGIARQATLAFSNTRLYSDARRRLEHLQALRSNEVAMATSRNLKENLALLLTNITEQLQIDAAVFLLLDAHTQQLEFAVSHGFQTTTLQYTNLAPGQGMAGQAALQRTIIHIADLSANPQSLADAPGLVQEGFASYYAAPLIAQGQVKGVLELFHRSPLKPNQEWMSFLEALAHQAAIAIESATLFEGLQQANHELSQAYDSTIEGWSHALDMRDKETEGHSRRVTQMTLRLARELGFSDEELVHVRRGALLHDIGKMGIPDSILLKPGKLSEEEWAIMRRHPQMAYDMLAPISYLRPALAIPYCHHEKWDGSGYPRGLKGEEIPLEARLFAIVDVWDALSSDRPYRTAWPEQKVLEHIQAGSGTHFDPKVVALFLRVRQARIEATPEVC
jgi:putative nucleotidyltransferase with HDIG domain